ncbi:MAG TPA: helix-turn-helix domain-containing protein [Solirubrobacterales bacterium]|nr:helix-turn-helix domain-containing protein [Solirubrobacterales bacterium]
MSSAAADGIRDDLASRLRARRPEIEESILTRVNAVSDPSHVPDLEYMRGLQAAVRAAVNYGLAAIELGDDRSLPPPPQLRAQARLAARNGIGLDTVLRKYFAGQAVIADYVVAEAERSGPQAARQLKLMLRAQAAVFDRLIAAVTEEHCREAENEAGLARDHRTELTKRLLAGEPVDDSRLGYPLDGNHLALVAMGPQAAEAVRAIAAPLDRNLLLVREDDAVWAWLGGRRGLDLAELEEKLPPDLPAGLDLAIGEPGEGLAGWRLSHRQARAALPFAGRSEDPFVRYSEVALLTSVLRDDLLVTSLRTMYLKPLEEERDGGTMLRETLRAYFATGRNAASTAAAMRVSRQTITNRLRTVEDKIAQPITTCATELEVALRL